MASLNSIQSNNVGRPWKKPDVGQPQMAMAAPDLSLGPASLEQGRKTMHGRVSSQAENAHCRSVQRRRDLGQLPVIVGNRLEDRLGAAMAGDRLGREVEAGDRGAETVR